MLTHTAAICALSPSSENCFIAYPARSSMSPFSPSNGSSNPSYVSGDVELFDALGPQTTNIVQAHKSAVSCISMNSEGTLLATASEKVGRGCAQAIRMLIPSLL